ncbi:Protein of unknown function DUF58 [Trichormus variabilis ATCC 29413]|uniref:DUF58 domain-containing protein n=2 Tax=Anabaena variabilis TaxID=264691 RepID=Q3MCM1_TRIV2|nr:MULTISPECIES: DUF58 domain-containing protein [Nostocaceae]ABA21265.1 Protein of unknown function DUF58 [Trichormus variabilis ATCC 29413]MBC1214228.1 DUF58 domain-containing protein [Trichormus variabilis ARAD]MBC1254164.1 DUF58 domain-containing protein [Trichormus variabilis V5]MBC1266332.1 DUF58 domain-containing protein [Trichormus variabilis FSR]MBC1301052.1 DUF58 domain-containing protein [Trichormus variabilis N2B]
MKIIKPITDWLEIRASAPAYTGWVLVGVAVCFFGAAINTMAGWLYAISGVSFALLGIAAVLPPRSLTGLSVTRYPIQPVSAGDDLTLELEIHNPTKQSVSLLQVEDLLPFVLGKPIKQGVETIASQDSYRWVHYQPTQNRGIYRWHTVELGTGAPLGLFWCRRQRQCDATAIVYPTVLPLTTCPLVDELGQEESQRSEYRGQPLQTASSGLVRSLRPYRIGDPTRLIHWRTSARYGELRVRELEMVTSGQEIIIALDSAGNWSAENFEQAVITAASLYFYAQRQQLQVQIWTASTGLIKGERLVLETLAATKFLEEATNCEPPNSPWIWLTQNSLNLSSLPQGSRWVLWQDISSHKEQVVINKDYPGIILEQEKPLQLQLQQPLHL